MAITYMNGEQIINFAASTTQQVSGMSVAEATTALGGKVYNNNGLTAIYTFPGALNKGGTPVTLEAKYASQMWDYFKISGAAAISSLGTAAAGATSWAQGVLFGNPELAGTLAGSGGLLTMSLPAAASVMAPLLGVSIGGAMYELAPEFWTKVSQALLPWAYDDKDTIAFVVDQFGQVFAPKGAVEALQNVIEEEGIESKEEASSDLISVSVPVYSGRIVTRPDPGSSISSFFRGGSACTAYSTLGATYRSNVVLASASPFTYYYGDYYHPEEREYNIISGSARSYTHNNKTVYWATFNTGEKGRSPVLKEMPGDYVAWTLIYGTITEGGYFPEGTSAWRGDSVDVSQLTTKPVLSGLDGSMTDYIPITLPIGDPTVTNDPAIQPNPTAPVDPSQLDPYISPVTSPEMWPIFSPEVPVVEPGAKVAPQTGSDPIYVPQPDLNPETDPTLIPDVEPAKDLPTNIQNPTSGGQSPDPIFPVPDIPFPSWMPAGSDTPVPSGQPGFIQVYHPQPDKFIEFGRWLWVTYADATIDKIWNNPFDGVIGAHELYASPSDDGYSTIRCGFLDSGVETQVVRQRYTQINCGSMVIPEYWGNYLDYSPYSQAMLYLPFIGIVPLEVDDIVGHAVNVLYHVDSYTGSCIAQVTVARDNYSNTLYQFSGNCSVEIPLAGASQAQIKAALMTANAYQNAANISANLTGLGGLGSGIASAIGGLLSGGAIASTGNFGGGMAAGIGGAASGVSQIIHGYTGAKSQQVYGEAQHTANMLSGKAIVQHSGSFGSSHGAMGIKKPYLIIRRPIQKVVNGYQELYGYPAHKQVIIGSCTGYLRCREVHVVSSLATDAEKNQIESLLKGGVYVTESVN